MRPVTPRNLRRLLDTPVFGIVATIQPDGTPQQSVVWIGRDGDDVLFYLAAGSRKEKNLRRDPRVSVLVNPVDAPYTYAVIQGTATFEPDRALALRDELTAKYVGISHAEHIARTPEAAYAGEVTAVRVTPNRILGRL
ncbi:PPOX class probable F420-dependent enzyme [Actinoalloteichus hoggarensis]|uniref:Putative pyridoxine/pyridoxamine 5'-phosphate oxidase n=1 Tax=Actinoalloteichus hoggarensis TaxID=1470176 RepID=A0A221VZE3_9PSEU|nr:PPOX class F420-dependent oxidoreductase [Actinoalloteichus hoggarensis]ASO18889.1 Putative pyridoxine/pyridoxamine 5'-phosphate oxidase [Actinoalloteichus hoggarensis]MBB5920124.1 PPOX class probable F420-dependent enzyme [Actinoalloteichus hoggarensis]